MRLFRELLSTPTTRLGRAGRFAAFQIKLWSHCIRLLKRNRAGQQAAALSYYTIFGLVPLAIVVLLVFQWLPGSQDTAERLKNFTYHELHLDTIEYSPPSDDEGQTNIEGDETSEGETVMLTDYLDSIIARFFGGLSRGSLSFVSIVLVIWAALALVSTIERAFNHIWHVSRGRGFLHRMFNYWGLLTLGPLLIGAGIYGTTRYVAFQNIEATVLTHIGPIALSYLLSLLALFLLYFVLPNTKVNPGAALWGAAVAALVWSLAKWGFGKYVTEFIPYSRVYGVVGLIPLSVFWVYVTWLIVLFGLQLTYTTQHLKVLDAAEIAAAQQEQQERFITNDLTAINLFREIAEAFLQNEGPLSPQVLSSRLNMPVEFGEEMLELLVDRGLLAKTSEPPGFIPARDPEGIPLSEITKAVAAVAIAQPNLAEHETLARLIGAQQQFLARHTVREILESAQPQRPQRSKVTGEPYGDETPTDTSQA